MISWFPFIPPKAFLKAVMSNENSKSLPIEVQRMKRRKECVTWLVWVWNSATGGTWLDEQSNECSFCLRKSLRSVWLFLQSWTRAPKNWVTIWAYWMAFCTIDRRWWREMAPV